MKNIMTDVMERTYEKLKHFDNHMKKSVTEPYGTTKLTEKQQYENFQSMTPGQLIETLGTLSGDPKGFKQFNDWLYKMEQRGQNAE